jgi:hypothetical protein
MRDVLETLKKLPPACAAVINGQAVIIRRGAPEPGEALGIGKDQVDQRNAKLGVTPQQVQAMIVGVTLGWDKDGADPDTHAEDYDSSPGPFTYEYLGEIEVTIRVTAPTEEAAFDLAKGRLRDLREQLDLRNPYPSSLGGFGISETLDLLETDDPK